MRETFDLLCELSFETNTTNRQSGVQSIIDQILPNLDDDSLEDKLERFIYKYDHEYDKAIDMSPHGIQQSTKKLIIDDLKTLLED